MAVGALVVLACFAFPVVASVADDTTPQNEAGSAKPTGRPVASESEVADGPRSVILDQVTNGLAVRMAVLFLVNQAAATK